MWPGNDVGREIGDDLHPGILFYEKNNPHLFQGDRKIKRKPLREKTKQKSLISPPTQPSARFRQHTKKHKSKLSQPPCIRRRNWIRWVWRQRLIFFFFLSFPPHSSNRSKSISSIYGYGFQKWERYRYRSTFCWCNPVLSWNCRHTGKIAYECKETLLNSDASKMRELMTGNVPGKIREQ